MDTSVIQPLTAEALPEYIKSGVVLVDFYAEWCQPCQRMMKILPKFAEEYKDKVKFAKVDIDTLPTTFTGIHVIPTFWLYKDGKRVEDWEGIKTLLEIKHILDKWL